MKTLEALYQEVLASDEKKKELAQAAQDEKTLENWIRAQGCDATSDQVQEFLKEKQAKSGELSDDELSAAAGGGCDTREAVYSAITVGISCGMVAIVSAINGEVGRKEGTDVVLCHEDN